MSAELPPVITREDSGGAGRFVMRGSSGIIGTLDFTGPRAGVLQINYVEVRPEARGAGLGRQLVEAAVHWARDHQLTVVPLCSYARSVIQADPSLRERA
jgi:predicted GNAT family acetyltransferase